MMSNFVADNLKEWIKQVQGEYCSQQVLCGWIWSASFCLIFPSDDFCLCHHPVLRFYLQGKDRLFDALFTLPGQQDKKGTSFLLQNAFFTTFAPDVPSREQLAEYDLGLCEECW